MSDELVSLGRSGADAVSLDTPVSAPFESVALPHVVELPTRYYDRLAVGETIREFAEIATVEMKVEEGALRLTFTRIDREAGDVLAEFLNHALYASAIGSAGGPELSR